MVPGGDRPGRAREAGGRQQGAVTQTGELGLGLQGGLVVSQMEEGGVTPGTAACGQVHSLRPEKPGSKAWTSTRKQLDFLQGWTGEDHITGS